MISETMARRYWPERDPIGERVWFDGVEPKEHWLTIVGVAADVIRPDGARAGYGLRVLLATADSRYLVSATVVVRGKHEAKAMAPALRTVIRQVQPQAAVTFRTLDDVLAGATARQRFQTQVQSWFAVMALVLGMVGLYGVMSYLVASNQTAIGIRMALGARPSDVFRSLVWRALALAGAGSAISLAGCVAIRGVLSKVVFGVGPSEPKVLAGAAAAMLGIALAACWVPARRAMRVDPAEVLRGE
jgi:putative ABC transport system permease protein